MLATFALSQVQKTPSDQCCTTVGCNINQSDRHNRNRPIGGEFQAGARLSEYLETATQGLAVKLQRSEGVEHLVTRQVARHSKARPIAGCETGGLRRGHLESDLRGRRAVKAPRIERESRDFNIRTGPGLFR